MSTEAIPEELREKAKEVATAVWYYDGGAGDTFDGCHEAIGRALLAERLAERERCAKLLDCGCCDYCEWDACAAAIRSQS